MLHDCRGHRLTGADAQSLPHYEAALREFNLYINDPVASVDKAIASSPNFLMAHALRAWLHLLGTEPAGTPVAHEALATAQRLPATTQEQGHLAAIEHLVAGRWHAASQTLEDIAAEHPRDLLALQAGQLLDFFRGDSRMLRDRIARALPKWFPGVPGYHTVLGLHAFGLEETGDYAAAEKTGREAVERERRNSWAQHAVAHVMEMQGRQQDGIGWMLNNTDGWSKDSFFAVHNWWHVALYHLDLGHIDEVLTLFDGPIYGARSRLILEMIDASAMLWRLHLRGIDVGDRWQAVADAWETVADAGNYAFNDAHAAMAFVGAGRPQSLARVIEAQMQAMQRSDDNAAFTPRRRPPGGAGDQGVRRPQLCRDGVAAARGAQHRAPLRRQPRPARPHRPHLDRVGAAREPARARLGARRRARGGAADEPAGAAVRAARRGDAEGGVSFVPLERRLSHRAVVTAPSPRLRGEGMETRSTISGGVRGAINTRRVSTRNLVIILLSCVWLLMAWQAG